MAEQDTSEIDADSGDSEAPDAATASGPRADDRNEELDESPVPDPESTRGGGDDDPGAD
jgi:hypothetical protein